MQRAVVRAMPWVFVLIWSTGFVVARLAMPHAPPFKFLGVRFALSAVCYGAWIVLARAPLAAGLQPVLPALWVTATSARAGAASHRVSGRQWLGLLLGLGGLALVV